MSFNPITNQPLMDYKSQQNKIENKDYIKNKKEQIPMEYNPYKNPYSAYQGHP